MEEEEKVEVQYIYLNGNNRITMTGKTILMYGHGEKPKKHIIPS